MRGREFIDDDLRARVSGVVERPLDAVEIDDVAARAVWSCLVEPGDGVAGRLVAALGAAAALREVSGGGSDGRAIDAADIGREEWRRALARWRPRLERFATDALRTGLPVHILAKVMGHLNLNTTQGYAAVCDEDVARHFREFVDRRRSLRPAEDYREPTPTEVEEFQEHFAKRKVELGSCSRGYGTPCIHEHACIRCPMLRPDPTQRHRLESIRANLIDRQGEATRMGWRGELEGIEISLRAADEKLIQMTRIVRLTLERRPPAQPF